MLSSYLFFLALFAYFTEVFSSQSLTKCLRILMSESWQHSSVSKQESNKSHFIHRETEALALFISR